jgi:hypothetical protein
MGSKAPAQHEVRTECDGLPDEAMNDILHKTRERIRTDRDKRGFNPWTMVALRMARQARTRSYE